MPNRLVVFVCLLLFACAEGDPVARVIGDVADAAEARDAEAVMEHIASSYQDRAALEQNLRRYFFGYRSIDVDVRDLQASQAGATFFVDFHGIPKEIGSLADVLPRSATYRFDVYLTREDGELKVSAAKWEAIR